MPTHQIIQADEQCSGRRNRDQPADATTIPPQPTHRVCTRSVRAATPSASAMAALRATCSTKL